MSADYQTKPLRITSFRANRKQVQGWSCQANLVCSAPEQTVSDQSEQDHLVKNLYISIFLIAAFS